MSWKWTQQHIYLIHKVLKLKDFVLLHLPVVVLDNVTNCPDGCQILVVALRVDVVEGHG